MSNWIIQRRGAGWQRATVAPGELTREQLQAEVSRLRRELARAEMEREIVKKSRRVLCEGVTARYAFVKQVLTHNAYPVSRVCAVLDVSRSATASG